MNEQNVETEDIVQDEDNQISDLHEDESIPFRYAITSYGADFDVEGLVKRISRGDIFIPPFQRGYVWNIKQASKFIESLLLGLPVPGIFLSRDTYTQKLLVIDGQQRLRTLQCFFDGVFEPTNAEFSLKLDNQGNNDNIRSVDGLTYKHLGEEDRRMLHDAIIHATIIRQDEPDDGDSSIYLVFERLNTGGNQLQPQEIRAALYHGPFNDLLAKLSDNKDWRTLFGKKSPRRRDEELILRFLALYYQGDNYVKTMKGFLNNFMGRNRDLKEFSSEQISNNFEATVSIIAKCIGTKSFRPIRALNAAVFDSVMVGVCRRLARGEITDCEVFKQSYDELLSNEAYIDLIRKATGDDERLKQRLRMAVDAFKDVL
jgi:uncharacterized protein with ParB-like and HNH nuclease domain